MKKSWILPISAFVFGLIIGIFSSNRLLPLNAPDKKGFEARQGGLNFVNPLLECEVAGESIEFVELRSFKKNLQSLIDSLKNRGWTNFSAVYFRDLNNGPWFGINEKEKFSPASLLKVPLMMSYFKEAETNPKILGDRIKFEDLQNSNSSENVKPSSILHPGETYTVEELLRRSIIYSDNNAYLLLLRHFDQKKLIATYTDLNVPLPIDGADENIMTVKQYATFFRILFNSSYLDRKMSIRALELLSKTEFIAGLVAGVPSNVGVVHKFGERTYPGKDIEKQMHDCGIVYYPNHPYLICVMTRGDSFEHLDDSIREISALVFKNVDEQYGVHN